MVRYIWTCSEWYQVASQLHLKNKLSFRTWFFVCGLFLLCGCSYINICIWYSPLKRMHSGTSGHTRSNSQDPVCYMSRYPLKQQVGSVISSSFTFWFLRFCFKIFLVNLTVLFFFNWSLFNKFWWLISLGILFGCPLKSSLLPARTMVQLQWILKRDLWLWWWVVKLIACDLTVSFAPLKNNPQNTSSKENKWWLICVRVNVGSIVQRRTVANACFLGEMFKCCKIIRWL